MALRVAVLAMLVAFSGATPMRGFAYTTYSAGQYQTAGSDQVLASLAATGATHIELLVTWYQEELNSTTIFQDPQRTPTLDDLRHVLQTAAKLNLSVILKPHVDVIAGPWRGEIGPAFGHNETAWAAWFASYTAYITGMAKFAATTDIWAFNIGTEMLGVSMRTPEWLTIIASVREAFRGPLLYGANWGDEPWQVQFWDKLDYIGVDAYYPMSQWDDPNATTIDEHWVPVLANLSALSSRWGKSIIFAEIGYRSFASAAIYPGVWQGTGPADLETQVVLWTQFFAVSMLKQFELMSVCPHALLCAERTLIAVPQHVPPTSL
eukprot:TRINITY_DN22670_c0_g1_i1.p1 TRINITY_DN22670_c0_g1~~TRINITY_DN22670_c0_g1_i1.p1  ORF type:complete len:321 (+),score=63.11 TRINITY_DN22670_c0_g1_i1:149-1111(+)